MVHETTVEVRSYELDSFGHVNHAVFLNYFEYARFQALEDAGFPPPKLLAEGTGIHVVRVEVDYVREARLGQQLTIRTTPAEIRNSSMTLAQEARHEDTVLARARVVIVWIGADGRPTRIPDDVRAAF
jgi:acyl-CoA thioester hydrolase